MSGLDPRPAMLTGAVTGANGFVGRSFCAAWRLRGGTVREIVRSTERLAEERAGRWAVGDIGPDTEWARALEGVDWVLHCAGAAHADGPDSSGQVARYMKVNAEGTANLARQAVACGVRRFVFVSTIGVLGNSTSGRAPFTAADPPAPCSAYARSKWDAEIAVREIGSRTGMEVVIVRPPLVYGPSAPGNFSKLVRLVDLGVPLPLGRVRNRRAQIGIGNLVDVLAHCVSGIDARQKSFVVSDGNDLPTADLVRMIARALGKPARIVPVPLMALRAVSQVLGRLDDFMRVTGSLQIDIRETCDSLDWRPPFSVEEGIIHALLAYRKPYAASA